MIWTVPLLLHEWVYFYAKHISKIEDLKSDVGAAGGVAAPVTFHFRPTKPGLYMLTHAHSGALTSTAQCNTHGHQMIWCHLFIGSKRNRRFHSVSALDVGHLYRLWCHGQRIKRSGLWCAPRHSEENKTIWRCSENFVIVCLRFVEWTWSQLILNLSLYWIKIRIKGIRIVILEMSGLSE